MHSPVAIDQYRPAIPDELWRKYSYLELYTFDGGGGFINRAILGTTDDREIVRRIRDGKLDGFAEFPYVDFHRFERWRSIEQSCWLNRCYVVACMAHAAWLDGDVALAKLVKTTMLYFLDTCPPPQGDAEILAHWQRVDYRKEYDYNRKTVEEFSKDETDVEYTWYDFQPGSRVINFLHAYYFIKDLAEFTDAEAQKLNDGIRAHGRVIFAQEKQLPEGEGNHQSLRQVGLLHAAAAFPADEETRTWAEFAVRRGGWHALNDFHENGVLFENSPSYHAFETWHGRDLLLLGERLGVAMEPAAAERFRAAARVLASYRRPDGRLLVFNDAYPLEPDPLLESLGVAVAELPKTTLLEQGGLAVWRSPEFYAALDVSAFTGEFSHYHGGKNALVLFKGKEALLDDPGCCNYDDPRFRQCKQAEYHSSLLVDGAPDSHNFSLYGFDTHSTMQFGSWQGDNFASRMTSDTPAWKDVAWTRALQCAPQRIVLTDAIEAASPHDYSFQFTLAPNCTAEVVGNAQVIVHKGDECVSMAFEATAPHELAVVPGENFQTDPALPIQQLRVRFKGVAKLRMTTVFDAE